MGMKGFSDEFESPEHYIIDITYKIWEQRGLQLIRDWSSDDCPVKTPMSSSVGVEPVISGTQATLDEFQDRHLLADDVIIGEWDEGTFYSSHRVRSPAHKSGAGLFGPAPKSPQPVTMLTFADCICKANQIVDEYLVRDNCGIAIQLGIDPAEQAKRMIDNGNRDGAMAAEDLVSRWSGEYFECGEAALAAPVVAAYEKRLGALQGLASWQEHYDRAVRFEGSGHHLSYGFERMAQWDTARLQGLSDPKFKVHHLIVKQTAGKPVRVAMRWSLTAMHAQASMFGEGSGARVALLGVSHFELRDGKILNEWCIFDELSLYAQLMLK
mmetsp:Transcript_21058/g.49458  ORF Transcript_21058/g.49458 Transcript_21058/m.49458 type:complete len:325 (-) Transcript_21058:182-1156(-)